MGNLHIVILVLFIIHQAVSDCPDGFIKHQGSCYMVFGGLTANWIDAKKYCKAFGSDLVVIETLAEQTFLDGYLNRLGKGAFSVGDFWIDGSDLIEEGTWRWVSQDRVMTYTNWAPGNPSNDNKNEHCMEIEFTHHDGWNDDVCQKVQNFICEKESTIPNAEVIG